MGAELHINLILHRTEQRVPIFCINLKGDLKVNGDLTCGGVGVDVVLPPDMISSVMSRPP